MKIQQRICSTCGRPIRGTGIHLADQYYCCDGCAQKTGCLCKWHTDIALKQPLTTVSTFFERQTP
jgi:hypothetical protein